MSSLPSGFEDLRVKAYFSHLVAQVGIAPEVQSVVVAHMVSNSLHFLPALNSLAPIALLLPKPNSRASSEAERIRALEYPERDLDRFWTKEPEKVIKRLTERLDPSKCFVIVDIGGYFAEVTDSIAEHFGPRFLGIMEGTENGVQKYELQAPFTSVVATVARSPLKLPEDFLVGASIVYSIEALLRTQAQILQTRTACLIGYGRVGSGVAEVLRGRGIPTVIHDSSPIAMAEASARGFPVFRRLDEALSSAGLVVSATGNHALGKSALAALRSGTVVATVTSADDEFAEDKPLGGWAASAVDGGPITGNEDIVRYDSDTGKYFWLINDGKPANFVHGAVIGPAIQLIEGEKLMLVKRLTERALSPTSGVAELETTDREAVARIWNEHFLPD